MTKEDIIRMAREAGFAEKYGYVTDLVCIERFAALLAAAQKEASAKVLDEMAEQDKHSNYYAVAARVLRARSKS